jgi:hypothetical protein
MSESSATLHEPPGRLTDGTIELHRALVSLQEELEAIDWYRQRSDASRDDALRATLEHNMAEEIEHASMLLEWLRRHHSAFAAQFDTYLYSEGSICEVEKGAVEASLTAEDSEPSGDAGRDEVSGAGFTVGPMKESS